MMKQTIALVLLLLGSAAAQDAVAAAEDFAELDALDELNQLEEFGEDFDEEVVVIDPGSYHEPNLRGNPRELQYVGRNSACNFCGNGNAPTRNVGVAILGMPGSHTCMSLYNKGRAGQIPFNYCPVMRTTLKSKCGCGGGSNNNNRNRYSNGSARTSNWRANNSRVNTSSRWKSRSNTSRGNWRWSTASDYSGRFLRFLGLTDD